MGNMGEFSIMITLLARYNAPISTLPVNRWNEKIETESRLWRLACEIQLNTNTSSLVEIFLFL